MQFFRIIVYFIQKQEDRPGLVALKIRHRYNHDFFFFFIQILSMTCLTVALISLQLCSLAFTDIHYLNGIAL
jgi:hypothetical protein